MREKRQVALYTMGCNVIYVSEVSAYNTDIQISKAVEVEFEERDKDELMQAKVAAVEIEIAEANNVLQKALQKKQELLALEHKE